MSRRLRAGHSDDAPVTRVNPMLKTSKLNHTTEQPIETVDELILKKLCAQPSAGIVQRGHVAYVELSSTVQGFVKHSNSRRNWTSL